MCTWGEKVSKCFQRMERVSSEASRKIVSYLIDKENTRNKLSNTLVNVFVDDLVDFCPQLVGNLSLPWLHELTHHAHDILTTLRLRVGNVEIM